MLLQQPGHDFANASPPRPMVLQDHDLASRRESSRLRAVSAEFPLQRAPGGTASVCESLRYHAPNNEAWSGEWRGNVRVGRLPRW